MKGDFFWIKHESDTFRLFLHVFSLYDMFKSGNHLVNINFFFSVYINGCVWNWSNAIIILWTSVVTVYPLIKTFGFDCTCVTRCVCYLCMPEHSMQSRMPRLMLAQRGSAWPQSQHTSFPGRDCTLCRTLSPLALLSRGSLAESMLLVDGDAVLSKRWEERVIHCS